MKIFDTHFHLPDEGIESFPGFDRAINDHIEQSKSTLCISDSKIDLALLCAGGDHAGSIIAGKYAHTHCNCFYSCGVHPHQAAEYLKSPEDFSIFKNDDKLAAIGEIGLDYFYEESPIPEQLETFDRFLAMALEWDLPAMLHIRDKDGAFDAGQDALDRLKIFAGKGGRFVIHCCTIPQERIADFLDLGAMIGVTGMISFKRADNIREMLKKVPDDRLLLETDSPYLAPVPFRGKSNTPGLLILAAQALAAERKMTLDEICEITSTNAENFYIRPLLEKGYTSCI